MVNRWCVRVTLFGVALLLAAGPAQARRKPRPPYVPKHPTVRVHHVSYGAVIPAGKATRVTVVPSRQLRVIVPHVGSLLIPKDAVTRRTLLTLRPARAVLTGGVQPAALGLDVSLHHTKLRKPLTWVQKVGRQPDGTVAVFLHHADGGGWSLQRATVSRGYMTVRTTNWSFQVPSWLNPKEWAQWVGQRLTATLAGTTAPWICPDIPNWMGVVNYATTVHACAQRNNAGSVERGEVRIKNNRGYFQQITLPSSPGRDYVWVNDQSDRMRYVLSAATHTDQGTVVYLPYGDGGLMTVGYRRPGAAGSHVNGTIKVQTTYVSVAMDVIYALVDALAGDLAERVKHVATALILAKCAGVLDLAHGVLKSPWDAASGARFGSIYTCMATTVAEELKDPGKALAAARSLLDPSETQALEGDFANQLVSLGKKLHLLGAILWARPLLQQGWVASYDQMVNIWQRGGLSYIDVGLAGPRATPIIPPRPGGGSTTEPGPGPGGTVGGVPSGTHPETVGGVTHTFTDPASAGGTQGPSIPTASTVGVSCKLQGFRVADGNSWWYLIASSPWNDGFYASADAFYNNGRTSGSLLGTPKVDPNVPDCGSAAPPAPAVPSRTTPETAGGVTHTWSNPANAGGTQGPSIQSGQTVGVACKVQGFKVADGDTWWYLIAASPWNSAYYASADAFYNNGSTSGSLIGTPFVDTNVPDCGTSTGGGSTSTGKAETVGGVTHTWTDPASAGGSQGPSIQTGQTVGVLCKVQGFRVADGDTWWYKIGSSPWNGAYYASADAFYNNGQTSGSLIGTPFVDNTVPDCNAPPPPPPTWNETVGGVTHTWTNYTNAGGAQGPSIQNGQTVQVLCKVQGFRVADGDTWWYRIGTAPWNGSYYASADAFYNNGQTSGSLVGTPFVDNNVANC